MPGGADDFRMGCVDRRRGRSPARPTMSSSASKPSHYFMAAATKPSRTMPARPLSSSSRPPGVECRHLLDRIEPEALWLSCPGSADALIGGQALRRLQATAKVVGWDEGIEMSPELLVADYLRDRRVPRRDAHEFAGAVAGYGSSGRTTAFQGWVGCRLPARCRISQAEKSADRLERVAARVRRGEGRLSRSAPAPFRPPPSAVEPRQPGHPSPRSLRALPRRPSCPARASW